MGCNCGGSFQPDDGLVPADQQASWLSDPNYTWPPSQPAANQVTLSDADAPLVAPNGAQVWPPEGQ